MFVLLVLLGFLPFALGGAMNWFMMTHPNTLPPFGLIAMVTLLLWAAIPFAVRPYIRSTKKVVIGLNLIPFAVLILIGIQELVLQAYWRSYIGMWTQIYYLPLMNISSSLTRWSHSLFSAYCAAFLLMVAAAALGCKLRKT